MNKSLSCGASQSAVRRRWLSLCTVWPLHSQISYLSTDILALGKARSRREPNVGCRGLTDLGDVTLCHKKNLHESCRTGRHIDADSLISSLGHCECDSHTVHQLSQRRLTADWLAPRERHRLRTDSKISSDWLPSYMKTTRPVLEIFKMDRYIPDSPCITKKSLFPFLDTKSIIHDHNAINKEDKIITNVHILNNRKRGT